MNLKALTPGDTVRVKIKDWQNKPGRKTLRRFVGTEKRFGDIPCYLFTSALRRGVFWQRQLVSVPQYCILECERITP